MSQLLPTVSRRGKLATELAAHGMVDMMVSLTSTPDWMGRGIDKEIGTCKACKKGIFQMCDNGVINGETKGGGCELLFFPFNTP